MSLAGARRVRETPREVAVCDERQLLTWSQFDSQSNRTINAIIAQKFPDNSRLAVFATNSVEYIISIVAALQAGVASVPINFHLIAEEVAYILRDSDTELLFVSPETAKVGLEAAAIAGVKTVVGWRCEKMDGLVDWAQWLAESSEEEPPTDRLIKPHLQYTSGTTGNPKAVETPPTMFPIATTAIDFFRLLDGRYEAVGSPSPVLIVSPMYHTGPMNWIRFVASGACAVVLSRFDANTVLDVIDRYKIQGTMLVPTHFHRLLALPEGIRSTYNLESLKYVSHTGAACPREVKHAMIEWWGPVFVEAYGGTESGSVTLINSEEWLKKPGSVGRITPPYQGLVFNEASELLGPNEEGRLYFRDTTGRGIVYHNDPEKTAAAHIEPGVFTLGEIGYYDEEGYLFITDRFSDLVVSGGVNIYPAEVEKVLVLHPDVVDVAVIGIPDAQMGEAVLAMVIARDITHPPAAEELLEFCRERLARFKCPKTFEFVEDIGRNAMGKVNKKDLRSRYWSGAQRVG